MFAGDKTKKTYTAAELAEFGKTAQYEDDHPWDCDCRTCEDAAYADAGGYDD